MLFLPSPGPPTARSASCAGPGSRACARRSPSTAASAPARRIHVPARTRPSTAIRWSAGSAESASSTCPSESASSSIRASSGSSSASGSIPRERRARSSTRPRSHRSASWWRAIPNSHPRALPFAGLNDDVEDERRGEHLGGEVGGEVRAAGVADEVAEQQLLVAVIEGSEGLGVVDARGSTGSRPRCTCPTQGPSPLCSVAAEICDGARRRTFASAPVIERAAPAIVEVWRASRSSSSAGSTSVTRPPCTATPCGARTPTPPRRSPPRCSWSPGAGARQLPDEPLPWLYGVARRALADQRRGASRRVRLRDRLEGETVRGGDAGEGRRRWGGASLELPDQRPRARAESALARRIGKPCCCATGRSSSRHRSPASMGCSRAAAAVRLHRARGRLRGAWRSGPRRRPPGHSADGDVQSHPCVERAESA